MYCSSCGAAVPQNLSYCNRCGAKVSGAGVDGVNKPGELSPDSLVMTMAGVFVLGLGAIAVLIGVLKAVAGLDLPFLLAVIMLSFAVMLVVEGVLIWLLVSGRRGVRGVGDAEPPKGQKTRELGEAQARALPEPVPSVTEHTTRAFEPIRSARQSK